MATNDSGQTKIIIITSNEDIIQQFSSNTTNYTHIIDLDQNEQATGMDPSMINLAFFAQLSGVTSSNEQVYKRALDSSDDNRAKSVKVSKKSLDSICAICGDRAIGFNYDVLSCASCKAFFRRNVQHDLDKIRCLTGQNQCSVSHEIRRKCQKCRLKQCLVAGMKKDFMLTDEEKQRRREQLEQKRNIILTSTSTEIDRLPMNSNENQPILMATEEWLAIENVRSAFVSFIGTDHIQCACVDVSNVSSALISLSQFFHQNTLRFINFFRQINEFNHLHSDDRFVLIKYNIFPLFVISKCFYYKLINDCCSDGDNEEAVRHRRFFTLCGFSTNVRDTFVNIVLSLVQLTEQDPGVLSLLMAILIFSRGLSMNEEEPLLKDLPMVNQAQCHYTKLYWNYLVHRHGELQAVQHFSRLLTLILRIQLFAKLFREFLRTRYITSDMADRIAPLMQTALNIS